MRKQVTDTTKHEIKVGDTFYCNSFNRDVLFRVDEVKHDGVIGSGWDGTYHSGWFDWDWMEIVVIDSHIVDKILTKYGY